MRLKSDGTSIDTLATSCRTEDLSRTLATFETIKARKLSDGLELDENIAVLREAIKRQTESKFYMFHSVDVLGEMMGTLSRNPEGFAVFKRIGDKLIDICGGDGSNISDENIGRFIEKNNITEVFTGNIDGEFLGVKERYDVDYAEEWDNHITKQLTPEQIQLLESHGVKVRILNILA